jgi:hypothetical protein
MRVPPWPLRDKPLPDPDRIQQLRIDVETTPGPPAAVWREVALILLARLDRSPDKKLQHLAAIAYEEVWTLTHTWMGQEVDQEEFYEEYLDGMRRLDLPQVRPTKTDLHLAFLLCRKVYQQLKARPLKKLPEHERVEILDRVWQGVPGDRGPLPAFVIGESRVGSRAELTRTIVGAVLDIKAESLRSAFAALGWDIKSTDLYVQPVAPRHGGKKRTRPL